MPNPKKPHHLAVLDGSARKNPQRYRAEDRTHPEGLAPPPEHLSEDVKDIYREIEAAALPGLLQRSDTLAVEITAELLHEYRQNPERFPSGKLNILTSWLYKLGLTPGAAQRFPLPPKNDSPSDDAFSKWVEEYG